MTDLQEKAMRMALQLCDDIQKASSPYKYVIGTDVALDSRKVLEALRQALAQPEQEPVAWMMVNKAHGLSSSLHWKPQEDWHITWECKPLYTAPPKREWVGLTDEERRNFMIAIWPKEATLADFICAIEAKLKEKNT